MTNPYVCLVEQTTINDDFIVLLSPGKMAEIRLSHNDIVQITGNGSSKTVVIAQKGDCDDYKILMNKVIRHNLGVYLKDAVTVLPCPAIFPGISIYVSIIVSESDKGISRHICKQLLKQYFAVQQCPIHEKNKFVVRGGGRALEFIVIGTVPENYCIVTSKTEIFVLNTIKKYEVGERMISDFSYDDIGGQNSQLSQLREIEFPLKFPTLFKALKITSPRALLHGPEGVGKVLMARAIANETGAHFVFIDDKTIKSSDTEGSIFKLQKKFAEARNNSPSVICIDKLDVLAPEKFKEDQDEIITNRLVNLVNSLNNKSVVILIGVTSQINKVHKDVFFLFLNSNMDKQIKFEIPDLHGRLQILKIQTKNMKITKDFNLKEVSSDTINYTGANLADLCKKVVLKCSQKEDDSMLISDDVEDDIDFLFNHAISNKEFKQCLDKA